MEELVKKLAKARQDLELATLCRDALYDEATTTPQWHAYEEQRTEVEQLKLEVQAADAELREGALAEHQLTGAKHLFGGVQIKMFTVLAYDPDKAKSYCINHGLQAALKLDTKVFERAVPVLGLDWVAVEQEPRATIPTDLSAYVPAPEPEPSESPCEGCTKSMSLTGRMCTPDVGDACYPAPEPLPAVAPVPIAA